MGRTRLPEHLQTLVDAAVADQDARIPRAARLELTLPFPPSVNNLYETVRTQDGRLLRKKSKRGRHFEGAVQTALTAWRQANPCRPPEPPYSLTLYVYPPRDGRAHDLSNLVKAPEDALFAAIGEDDRHVVRLICVKFEPCRDPRIVLRLEGMASEGSGR